MVRSDQTRSNLTRDERQVLGVESVMDLRTVRVLPSQASPNTLCDAAVRTAESRHRLPSGLLFAISQVESGRPDAALRRLEPWPWTVQAEGRGIYFESKAQAVQWVKDARARGVTSIDTGCLQVNLFYHPNAFASPEEAFDPERNADYAARFLLQLHASTGDWGQATGFYHSQTLPLAMSYRERIGRALTGEPLSAGMLSWPTAPKPPTALDRLGYAWRATLGNDSPAPTNPAPADPIVHDWNVLYSLKHSPQPPLPIWTQRLPRKTEQSFLASNIRRVE